MLPQLAKLHFATLNCKSHLNYHLIPLHRNVNGLDVSWNATDMKEIRSNNSRSLEFEASLVKFHKFV
jgi:hypothetical protein